jgi:hypothetical protein
MSLQDDYTALRKLMRRTAKNYPPPLPNYVENWWTAEQIIIAEEDAAAAARAAARRAEIEAKIAALEAELAGLP